MYTNNLLTMSAIQQSYTTPAPLIDGLLAARSLTLAVGAPGAGKSMILTHLAGAVARGDSSVSGLQATSGRVFYHAAESPNDVMERLLANQLKYGEIREDRLVLSKAQLSLHEPRGISDFHRSIAATFAPGGPFEAPPDLVIIDTLAAATPGRSENDAEATTALLSYIDQYILRPFKCSVLLCHHTAKNADTYRGSSALDGGVEARWLITREGATTMLDASPKDRLGIVETSEPLRFTQDTLPLYDFKTHYGEQKYGRYYESVRPLEDTLKSCLSIAHQRIVIAIAEAVETDGGIKKRDFEDAHQDLDGLGSNSWSTRLSQSVSKDPGLSAPGCWADLKGMCLRWASERGPQVTEFNF